MPANQVFDYESQGLARRAQRSRRWRVVATVGVVCTFMCIVIARGHGVAPVGMILFQPSGDFEAATLLSWCALALVSASAPVRGSIGGLLALLGNALLCGSYAWLISFTDANALVASLLSSIPCFACIS